MRPDCLAERTGAFHPSIAARIRAEDALKQELNELGAHAGVLIMHAQTEWASITFSGTRHALVYQFRGSDAVQWAETLIACLPESEFSIPHQLVADAAVTAVEHTADPPHMVVTLEVLVLDEE